MIKKKTIHTYFKDQSEDIEQMVLNFETEGQDFGEYQERNSMKIFELKGQIFNVKSFQVPNLINKIVYRFFRKSKAQRSYEYANILMQKGIGTPQPIAYFEYNTLFTFKNSFYVSQQQEADLTYRNLTFDLDYPDFENILRQFTRFTFLLHENEVNFLDHSPGNTLIKKTDEGYRFYLVDLNRMKFGPMTFEDRIINFAKLTIHKSMVETMSDEYAKCVNRPYEEVYNLMWKATAEFQDRWHRKQRLKKKLKFWKKY